MEDEFPLAHGCLGRAEHRPGVPQSVDLLYRAILVDGHIENEQPIKNNLVGNIYITCRSDFRRFVRLLRGGRRERPIKRKKPITRPLFMLLFYTLGPCLFP